MSSTETRMATLASSVASFGLGLFVTVFVTWIAGGHEASDVDGVGSTPASVGLLMALGFILIVFGIVWFLIGTRPGGSEARSRKVRVSFVVIALGAGSVTGALLAWVERQLAGPPNGVDYVTSLATSLAIGGLAIVVVGVVVWALGRRQRKRSLDV